MIDSAPFVAVVGTRRAMPNSRRAECTTESRIKDCAFMNSGAGTAGVSDGSVASAVRSTSNASNAMPPTPSVTV